ncbi:MAG TPA: YihY/virulence factor BrkB family protein [Candidatus Binatia bacterium]|nr:YihY/virulence factor BrkB family protein [Candidatus Binatia bacterium]
MKWLQRLREALWGEREGLARSPAQLRAAGRLGYALTRDLLEGQISMRAMSLVYTTLLSLVPLLALAFSVLKGLGVHNSLEPMLRNMLAPLGAQGDALTANILHFVDNIKVGVLGSLGMALLFYTVLSMIQKVEDSFNYIWRIEQPRRLGQRLGEYLSLLLVGPFAVVTSLGITASVMNSSFVGLVSSYEPFGLLIYIVGRLLPYVVIIGLFTFLYAFVPNTRVRLRAAASGGMLAGVLWESASIAFARIVVASSSYNAIYSSFAIIIFLLIWLYVGWLILLIGCQLAYYVQYPQRVTLTRIAPHLWGRAAETLGLQIVERVGRRFLDGEPPLTRDELHQCLPAVPEHVDGVLDILLHHNVLAEAGPSGQQLLPGRDLQALTLAGLWNLVRRGAEPERRTVHDDAARDAEQIIAGIEQVFARGDGGRSLRDWLQARAGDAPRRTRGG